MFPWSVMPIAGISSRCASASMGLTFAAPSSIEYSVWLCRCTKDREEEPLIGWPVYDRAPTDLGVSRCVSLPGCHLSRKAAGAGLRWQLQTIDEIAHRSIGAGQHEQLQDGFVPVIRSDLRPQFVVNCAVLMECIA